MGGDLVDFFDSKNIFTFTALLQNGSKPVNSISRLKGSPDQLPNRVTSLN